MQVLEIVRHWDAFKEAGWGNVVLIGMGTAKTALKYVNHLGFKGKITVDPELVTYAAAHMLYRTDVVKGYKADGIAAEKLASLTGGSIKAERYLVGSGITKAGQNGGFLCVARTGETPFYYVASGNWDMPDLNLLLQTLVGNKE